MRRVVIEWNPNGTKPHQADVVDEYGRRCGCLCLGELMEQVFVLVTTGREQYEMLTEEQDREKQARRAERYAAMRASEGAGRDAATPPF